MVSEQQARSLREQHAALSGKLRGHDAYYGVTGNAPALTRLRFAEARQWCKWLDRRGGRVPMTWKRQEGPDSLPASPAARGAQCVPLSSEPII